MNDSVIDWKSLSAKDFERLSRDLFARLLGQAVEAFPAGPDGAVDLRTHRGRTLIQCKRYTTSLSALLRALKEEVQKPAVRRAKHYMLATTLPLTPAAKEKIMHAIPALRNAADIFGADDLEGLLAQNRDLRALYPALWVGDADFLRALIREAMGKSSDRRSRQEMKEIAEWMPSFVPPPQAEDALRTLRESRALIITGEPGIGKTSLARHLIWQLCMGEGYEAVVSDGDWDDAWEAFNEDKKQVFFFDDFLGSTMLREGAGAPRGSSVAAFIRKLQHAEGKLLILTSREYIFRQAGQRDEDYRPERADFARFLLSMQPFGADFRRELLAALCCRHGLSRLRIRRLMQAPCPGVPCAADDIVRHPNFNPRLLDTALRRLSRARGRHAAGPFLMKALDDPYDLYENAFLHTLTAEQRDVPIVLGSLPALRTPELLQRALRAYSPAAADAMESSLRVLIGDFLTTRLLSRGELLIDFVNPGVEDFIRTYYTRSPQTAAKLIAAADMPDQMMHLLLTVGALLPPYLQEQLLRRLIRHLETQILREHVGPEELTMAHFMICVGLYPKPRQKSPLMAALFAAYLRRPLGGPRFAPSLLIQSIVERISLRAGEGIDWGHALEHLLRLCQHEADALNAVPALLPHLRHNKVKAERLREAGRTWAEGYLAHLHELSPAQMQQEADTWEHSDLSCACAALGLTPEPLRAAVQAHMNKLALRHG